MKREAVNSTSVASIGYRRGCRELEIEFRQSGDVYLYSHVPAEEYAAFLQAESKGRYLNLVFKPKEYPYTILKRGQG